MWPQHVTVLKAPTVDHIFNSRKQVSIHENFFTRNKMYFKRFLKVTNISYNFSSVEAWYRYLTVILRNVDLQTKYDIFTDKCTDKWQMKHRNDW